MYPGCEEKEYAGNVARSSDHELHGLNMKWIEWEDLHHILQDSENSSGTFTDSSAATGDCQPYEPATPVIARPFCVV